MPLQEFITKKEIVFYAELKTRPALLLEIQNKLLALGLLDPVIAGSEKQEFKPAATQDGQFGPSTQTMIELFGEMTNIPVGGAFTWKLAERLLAVQTVDFLPLHLTEAPGDTASTILAKRILRFLQQKGYWIARAPSMYNIVYIEGANADGRRNPDPDNAWNDRRIVIRAGAGGVPEIVLNVAATTEPSIAFAKTTTAKNRQGVARIAFGQYKAWSMGFHQRSKRGPNHPALTQTGLVRVHRDLNADGRRTGDKIFVGNEFGINQHSTSTITVPLEVGQWSEGCLVGQVWSEHEKFLALLQKDARYIRNDGYRFLTAVLDGDEFHTDMMR